MSLLAGLLPGTVRVMEAFGDELDAQGMPIHALSQQESGLVAHCSARRAREVTTGRHCARRALADLGAPVQGLGRRESGAPDWPRGIVGSLTHCRGYRAAAVAFATDLVAVGIDAEPRAPLPGRVLEAVLLEEERAALATRPGRDLADDRLVFCVKEAAYKVWYPLSGLPLTFHDASVTLHDGRFAVLPRARAAGLPPLEGQWTARAGLLIAAIVLAG